MVRCKFVCRSKTETRTLDNKSLYSYQFVAVYGDSPENKQFWEWTPSGQLTVDSVRDGQFEVSKTYYIDLTATE